MIHKACMPVYMNSGKIVADGTGRVDGDSKVLQEVLADLKTAVFTTRNSRFFQLRREDNQKEKVCHCSSCLVGRAILNGCFNL